MTNNCTLTKPDISGGVTITLQVLLVVSLLVVLWALAILLRCGRHLRHCARLALGHFLAIDIGLSVTGLFMLNLATARRTAEQIFYWLVILNWQTQLAMLLLATVNVTRLLDFDHVILIIVSSWAFSSSPVLYLNLTRGTVAACNRPVIWKPGLSTTSYLVIILPMFFSQVILLVLSIHSLLKQRRKLKGLTCLVSVSSMCRDCEARHRSHNSLFLMWCLVAGFIAYTLPLSIWHSYLASLGPNVVEDNYPWAAFLFPCLSGLVDGSVMLTLVRRFGLPTGINPCGRRNKQGHRDGGDHVHQGRGNGGKEPCLCPHCRRHCLSVIGLSTTGSPAPRRDSGDSGQPPA